MDILNYMGRRLTEEEVSFYRAFGFLIFRQLFSSREMSSMLQETRAALRIQYGDRAFDPTAALEAQRRQWALMMDADTSLHAALLEDSRIWTAARQLCGEDALGIKVQADRFGGDTPWHRDTYTALRGGVKFLWYHQPVDRASGALRLIPLSHVIGDNYLFEEKLRRLPVQNIPCAVLETRPGDVIAFDMRAWHGAWGGVERFAGSLTYYNNPKTQDEEEALRLRAWTNVRILMQEFGCKRQYFYSRDWLANRSGSPVRAAWITRLKDIGYFDSQGVVEPEKETRGKTARRRQLAG